MTVKRYSNRIVKLHKNCFRQLSLYYYGQKPSQLTRRQHQGHERLLCYKMMATDSYTKLT